MKVAVTGERGNKDSKAKAKHVKRGMKCRANRGDYNGGPAPYGYKWSATPVREVKNSKGEVKLVRDLMHDDPAAAIVRRIFREFVGGKKQMTIARDLRKEKVPARKTEWQQATISHMLKNPIYVGRVRTKGEERPGNHKAIIDEKTWDAAQQLLTTRSKGGRQVVGKHLFTNATLTCGRCGGPMYPHSPTDVYFCNNRARDAESCDQPRVKREVIDGPALAYFADAVLDVDATMAQLQATEDARRDEVTLQLQQAEREQLRLKGEREHVEREFRAGLSGKRYDEMCDKIDDEQAAAVAQVEQLRARKEELSSENLLAEIDSETAEKLTEIRAAIVEHVRGARDLDAVRAALLTTFDGFTLQRDKLQPRPRREALLGFVEHRLGPHRGMSQVGAVFERVSVSMPDTTQSNSSPSQ